MVPCFPIASATVTSAPGFQPDRREAKLRQATCEYCAAKAARLQGENR